MYLVLEIHTSVVYEEKKIVQITILESMAIQQTGTTTVPLRIQPLRDQGFAGLHDPKNPCW